VKNIIITSDPSSLAKPSRKQANRKNHKLISYMQPGLCLTKDIKKSLIKRRTFSFFKKKALHLSNSYVLIIFFINQKEYRQNRLCGFQEKKRTNCN
jgi:hypothetical protein